MTLGVIKQTETDLAAWLATEWVGQMNALFAGL